MSKPILYHNPQCSKSRKTLELLRERGLDLLVVEYLTTPPSRDTLVALLESADSDVAEFVRRGDAAFAEARLSLSANPSVDEVADLLVSHPRLMQRPILQANGRVAIGRPPERVLDILD